MKNKRPVPDDRVQRANIRRVQESGKRQSAMTSRRSSLSESNNQRFIPDRNGDKDVSVQVSRTVRRILTLLLIVVVAGCVIYAIVKNIAGDHLGKLPEHFTVAITKATSTIVPIGKRIGIVSGHRGNDSGAVCKDGLTEAQVNFAVSVSVADQLRAQGYTVDILNEFDTRLKGYQGALLLSIHADSCTYINDTATGFKVARVLDSKIPDVEDKLVACLTSEYMKSTNLHFHQNTVTYDMTKYHAFYEIDEHTPAAIIETGFLAMDRKLLTETPELVSDGIYHGLQCFLGGQ